MRQNIDEVLRAIRSKCLDCCGGSQKIVEHCNIPDCQLYPYRSVSALGDKKRRAKKGEPYQIHMEDIPTGIQAGVQT